MEETAETGLVGTTETGSVGTTKTGIVGTTKTGIVVTKHGSHIAEVILDRPQVLNAFSTQLARDTISIMRGLAGDGDVRAVIVSSSTDRAFSAGADLKERASFSDGELLAQRPVVRDLFASVRDLPMPAIAAVEGFAVGGGFELALSCDIIVAGEAAVFGLTEVTVGLVPGGGGTQLLARRVGIGTAAELTFTGRKVDADEAFSRGIVDRLVAAGGARETALAFARTMAANSPIAVRAAKRAVRAALGDMRAGLEVEDAAWHAAAVSADRREGIAAFAEKRAPRWSGR